MSNIPRYVKKFSSTNKKFYKSNQPVRTEKAPKPVDDMVNEWVRETGNIILSATPARQTVVEKDAEGTLIRKTTHYMTVVYQDEYSFMETEVEMRRRALIPAPKADESGASERETAATVAMVSGGVDSDAGGPEGLENVIPADDDDDD